MEDFTTYYEILEVAESASFEEIRTAYRRMAQEYHPDRVPEHLKKLRRDAEEKLKQINEAWSVLGNLAKRQQYDAELKRIREEEADDFEPAAPTPPPPRQRPQPPPSPPRLVISQTWFDFAGRGPTEELEGKFTVSVTGSGVLQATVKSSESWLRVLQDQIATSASQEIEFRIDSSKLQLRQAYSAKIIIQSNCGNADVRVSLSLDVKNEELVAYRRKMLALGFLLGGALGLLVYFLSPDVQTGNGIALIAGAVAVIGAIVAGAKLARWGGAIGAFFLAGIAADVLRSLSMSVYSAGAWGTIFGALLLAFSRRLLLEKYRRTSGAWVGVVAGCVALVGGVVAIGVYAANEIGRSARTQQAAISSRQIGAVPSTNDSRGSSGSGSIISTVDANGRRIFTNGDVPPNSPTNITGSWQGGYVFNGSTTTFELVLNQIGARLTGSMREAQSGMQDATSDISGESDGANIKFVKTYRENGAQFSYTGTLQPDGSSISGSWLGRGLSGTWRMSRVVVSGNSEARAAGILTIQTVPGDSEVLLDGKDYGESSADGTFQVRDVSQGEHELIVQKSGYSDARLLVEMGPGEKKNVSAPLKWSGGYLTVHAIPRGTTISITGMKEFSGDWSDNPCPAGTYTITASYPGMQTESRTVLVQPQEHATVEFNLSAISAYAPSHPTTLGTDASGGGKPIGSSPVLPSVPQALLASVYLRSHDLNEFEVAAAQALQRGGSVSIELMHEHSGLSGDSIHPVTITLTPTTITFDPGSSSCKYSRFSARLADLSVIELSNKATEGRFVAIVVRHIQPGTYLLHLDVRDPERSNDKVKLYLATADSYTVKQANNVNYLASRSNSSLVLGTMANVIRGAVATAVRR